MEPPNQRHLNTTNPTFNKLSVENPAHILYQHDVIEITTPKEDKIEITTLRENVFYYFGQPQLKHKLISIEDLGGVEGVLYPLQEIKSEKRITKTAMDQLSNWRRGELLEHQQFYHATDGQGEQDQSQCEERQTDQGFCDHQMFQSAQSKESAIPGRPPLHQQYGALFRGRDRRPEGRNQSILSFGGTKF